ncbi:MAG: hypothetical protein FJ026_04045 [Chloroflexi bacterium]|nr:hypothetical protein [Chloroflexota bacterium]
MPATKEQAQERGASCVESSLPPETHVVAAGAGGEQSPNRRVTDSSRAGVVIGGIALVVAI